MGGGGANFVDQYRALEEVGCQTDWVRRGMDQGFPSPISVVVEAIRLACVLCGL